MSDFDQTVMSANADSALRRPLAMLLVLAAIAGAMDAVDFHMYGVFTANQAGNLVLFWVRLTTEPGVAALSLFSLAGCAVGVATVLLLRSWFPYFASPRGSRALLYIAAGLLVVTASAGARLSQPLQNAGGNDALLGSGPW